MKLKDFIETWTCGVFIGIKVCLLVIAIRLLIIFSLGISAAYGSYVGIIVASVLGLLFIPFFIGRYLK